MAKKKTTKKAPKKKLPKKAVLPKEAAAKKVVKKKSAGRAVTKKVAAKKAKLAPKKRKVALKRILVDLSQVQQGPIRHKSLPPEMLEQIKKVFDMVGRYVDTTLEQFEVGFMRDMHPEREVAIWCNIAAASLAFHEKYLVDKRLADEEEGKLVGALVAISTGVEDVSELPVPAEVGRRLLQCYYDLAKGHDT